MTDDTTILNTEAVPNSKLIAMVLNWVNDVRKNTLQIPPIDTLIRGTRREPKICPLALSLPGVKTDVFGSGKELSVIPFYVYEFLTRFHSGEIPELDENA